MGKEARMEGGESGKKDGGSNKNRGKFRVARVIDFVVTEASISKVLG